MQMINLISSLAPIFSPVDRFISPTRNLEPARVPSGFWKIISYIGRDSKEIETNAFIVFQDETAIRAMKQVLNNPQINPFEVFQTSTTHIEKSDRNYISRNFI